MPNHTIIAFAQNHRGVLNKVTMLFRRKMYNINTLTACPTLTPGISQMTINVTSTAQDEVHHMIEQIKKIVEVTEAYELNRETSFWRETALIRCKLKKSRLESVETDSCVRVLNEKNGVCIVQVSGTHQQINTFMSDLPEESILEQARTGVTAMEIQ